MSAFGDVRADGGDVRGTLLPAAAVGPDNLVQPEAYASVGLDPKAAKAAARANTHDGDKLRDASSGLVAFLREVGLLGGPSELLWKRARLV